MGFWIFMLAMNLLIVFTMIGFGRYFMKCGPEKINHTFGYRTSMSMKNKDTWVFAHRYCGRLWVSIGSVMFLFSIVVFVLLFGRDIDTIGNYGGMLSGVLCACLMLPIIPTEIALRKRFDATGQLRQGGKTN